MKHAIVVSSVLFLGLMASPTAAHEPTIDKVQAAAKDFVDQLAAKKFTAATETFDSAMTKAMTSTQLQETWAAVVSSVGEYESQAAVRHQAAGQYDIVFVNCKFAKTSLAVRVVFDKQQKIAGLFFAPVSEAQEHKVADYVDPHAFADSDVIIGDDPWQLPGTLSIPKSKPPMPALILVHGSGPNDRDETVGANQPFKDLAGGLATLGVAVLRYDKRTKVHASKFAGVTDLTVNQEAVDDVIVAVDFLRSRSEIDAKRIFVLGHSLGGYLIPRFAVADVDHQIRGFISLAGSTRPMEDLIWEQTNYIFSLDGSISKSEQQQLDQLREQVDRVKSLDKTSPSVFGTPAAYWLDLRGYQPEVSAKSISRPLLILQGERDYQVTMEDFRNWKTALNDNHQVTFKSYPDLNHLMIAGDRKEYAK